MVVAKRLSKIEIGAIIGNIGLLAAVMTMVIG